MKKFAAVIMISFFAVFFLVELSDKTEAEVQSSIIIPQIKPEESPNKTGPIPEIPIKKPVKSVKIEHPAPVKMGKIQINVDKICDIESDNNANAKSYKIVKGKKVTLARGIMQVREAAWNDCIKEMKVNWSYKAYWNDPIKNKAVGSYYMNSEIPSLLNAYKIPDSIETRLAAYNYGPTNLEKIYKKYGKNWKNFLPKETRDYIMKYKN